MVQLRSLGRSDLRITPIGLGCWQFSAGKGLIGGYWEALPQDTVNAIVAVSLEGGINWFDTAEAYGNGASEDALAAALTAAGKRNGDVIVATKWWPFPRTAGHLKRTLSDRLRFLGGFGIDLHQIHQSFSLSPLSAQMNAMADLVEARKIRSVGVSNFSAKRMRAAHALLAKRGIPLVSNQMQYSLLRRGIEKNGVMAAAKELGITIIAYSPLAQGVLTGRFHEDPNAIRSRPGPRRWMSDFKRRGLERSHSLVEALKEIGAGHGVTASEVALAWLLQFHGDTVVAIPGASSAKQAQKNLGAMAISLSRAELDRIDELSRRWM